MSKIFCGIGEIPKGKRRGTMQECVDAKQIRYYGEKKITSQLLKKAVDSKTKTVLKKSDIKKEQKNEQLEYKEYKQKLMLKYMEVSGKIKNTKHILLTETGIVTLPKMKKQLEQLTSMKKEINDELNRLKTQKP